ncbi:MAG: tRNA (uridine(34)/cytosine(34)/5-carboxymethylaminomethyluridine(34)-2'-O)-methyltransferase TrmL [Clostridia bacterium]|nr:tRNA (uridine(34)/cytosine(34)/5-carboxymethylaminomethyluridine(34)-2'-O)-methyltransferase TrmL [Clostridia bacterium]MBR2874785.1 tRNA (uridine(34)/cytosine(34)/5-carboxymethylaminomethyluridine(34)-2'-O)-methyltransferase TrmL [Clostridia bacterium]
MKKINIVMVEPEIPQNTGNVARTCACTGASLHLVKPLGFEIDDKKMKRAGLDYWNSLDITYYDNLAQFLEMHKDDMDKMYFFTTKGQKRHSDIQYPDNAYLVFGKETKGLPEELLHDNYQNAVRIPMRDKLRSLNLSNSICVAVYEVLRQWDYDGLNEEGHLTKF